jgi:hypothetical protein
LALGMISRTSYRPYPKFLLLIKLTQGDVLWFTLRVLIVPKRSLSSWITIPCTEHPILLIR